MNAVTGIEAVHPDQSQAEFMPYAPGVSCTSGSEILFLSGATASPLYHQHPHVPEEHALPYDIETQTRRVMDNIKLILDYKGLTWRNVVKVTKYLTDMREADTMHAVMGEYMGDWRPASTMICVNNLSSPAARLELDMIVMVPGK